MRRYFNIDILAMREFGLTINEWYICQIIDFACQEKPEGFYVDYTRAEFGEYLGLSEDRTMKIIRSLVNRGYLKKNKKHSLRVSKTWKKVEKLNGKKLSEISQGETVANSKLEEELECEPNVPVNSKDYAVHFEAEFGEDEVSSMKKAPTKNETRKEAMKITKHRETTKEQAVVMADSFWYKQEGRDWKGVRKWKPLVRRFVDNWERNDNTNVKYEPTEKKIVNPLNVDEMRLFLKQMPDDDRDKLTFNLKNGEVIVIDGNTGVPLMKESRTYLVDTKYENFMNFLLGNFKKGKLRFG